MTELEQLQQRVKTLENLLANVIYDGRYRFLKDIEFGPNAHIASKTGRVGFFGTPPVTQNQFHFNALAGPTYTGTEQNILNGLQAALKSYGLIIN